MLWTNPHLLRSWPFSKLSCWRFDFLPRKFAACSKPPSRDNYRKASYPRTQQGDQGTGWTHDPAIRDVVKTTPLPIRPCLGLYLWIHLILTLSIYWRAQKISIKPWTLYLIDWKLTVLFFFVFTDHFSRTFRFIQSACLLFLCSLWFTCAKNMSNQVRRICMTAKNFATRANLFSSMLFCFSSHICFQSYKQIVYCSAVPRHRHKSQLTHEHAYTTVYNMLILLLLLFVS